MSRTRRVGLSLALFPLALLPSLSRDGARAHELHAKPACQLTFEKATEIGHRVVAENPDATFVVYSGDDARKLVDAMNAAPPVSAWTADQVVVIGAGDDLPFRVGLVENGCVTRALPVPHEVWSGILSAALGERS